MARPRDPAARQRLLVAAREEFAAKGLDAARVESICSAARLSKGAFYLHYASKTAAFEELVGSVIARLWVLTTRGSCVRPQSTADCARRTLEEWYAGDLALFEFLFENRDIFRLILRGGGSGKTQDLMQQLALSTEQQVATLLRTGMAAGLYRPDLQVETAAAFIAGGYDRAARRLLWSEEAPQLAKILLMLQQHVVVGIGSGALTVAMERVHSKA